MSYNDNLIPRVYEDGEPATGVPDPENATPLNYPVNFSSKAKAVLNALAGTEALYHYRGEFYLTDEACDLSEPRWRGLTLSELERWLERQE